MSTEATFVDVLHALGQSGCAICRLSARRADRFLAAYCYEHVNDVELREGIRNARGFCRRHASDFLGQLDSLAVAITYRDILATLVHELEDFPNALHAPSALAWLTRRRAGTNLQEPAACPVCEAVTRAEARALDVLAAQIGDIRVAQALRSGDPMCLSHLRSLLDRAAPTVELIARQRKGWSALRDHLLEICRKAEYESSEETLTANERQALRGAVEAVIGLAGLPDDDAAGEVRRMRRGGSNAIRSDRHPAHPSAP